MTYFPGQLHYRLIVTNLEISLARRVAGFFFCVKVLMIELIR